MSRNHNFQTASRFDFSVEKIPNVDFFVQTVKLPGITLGVAEEGTPFTKIPWPGDHITWEPLNITFKLDEEWKTWYEIHKWIIGQGFPEKFKQYYDLKHGLDKDLDGNLIVPIGKPKPKIGHIYSDATLLIHTSHNNPNIKITFSDAFPVFLSPLNFQTNLSDEKYLTCTVDFRYTYYIVEKI